MTLTYGNYAYRDKKGLYRCGWIDPHSDDGYGVSRYSKQFTIRVYHADPQAVLVHRVEGKLVKTYLKKGLTVSFNAYALHALLPEPVAEACVSRNGWYHARKFFKDTYPEDYPNRTCYDTKCRLCWKFID